MKKILFPTDFSDNALNAINYGTDMFGSNDISYTLFHATDNEDVEYINKEFAAIQKI